MDYNKLMKRARDQNKRFDRLDIKAGGTPMHKQPVMVQIRTAMAAIECGIKTADWNNVAEGQAMLEEIEKRFEVRIVNLPDYGSN